MFIQRFEIPQVEGVKCKALSLQRHDCQPVCQTSAPELIKEQE